MVTMNSPDNSSLKTSLETLDRVYGEKSLQFRSIANDIRDLNAMKDEVESLENGLGMLHNMYNNLIKKDLTADQMTFLLFSALVEDKLSSRSLGEFIKLKRQNRNPESALGNDCSIEHLFESVQRALASARHMEKRSPKKNEEKKPKDQRRSPPSSHATGGAPGGDTPKNNDDKKRDDSKCPFCDQKAHSQPNIVGCKKLPSLSKSQILKLAKKAKIKCMICLTKSCKKDCSFGVCTISGCGKNHCRFLHPKSKDEKPSSHSTETNKNEKEDKNASNA